MSNQAGISLKADKKAPPAHQSKLGVFKTKVSAVFGQLDFPISIYAATEKDIYRKPRSGMWKEMLEDYGIHSPGDVDLEQSIFVGDAGGRIAGDGKPKDFSCSDRYGWNMVLSTSCLHMAGILRIILVSSSIHPKNSSSMKPRGRSHVHLSHRDTLQMPLVQVRK